MLMRVIRLRVEVEAASRERSGGGFTSLCSLDQWRRMKTLCAWVPLMVSAFFFLIQAGFSRIAFLLLAAITE